MSVRLTDRSFQYPVGIAENMLVEAGKFTFPVDFVILDMEEDSKVPLILGRPFLHTADAVIRVKQRQLNLGVGTERINFNIDSAMKHSYSNDDTCFSIDVIDEILEEYFDALLDEGSKILYSIEGTLLEEEIFAEFDEFMAMTVDENSNSESDTKDAPFEKITINTNYKIKTSLEEPPTDLELKPLPDKSWNMRMPFGLCNAPATFQRCMLAIFHDMIEESVEIFMDDFSVFGNSFDTCLNNLDKMLQRCKDAHLVLNWEKCHFMVKEGIVLGHKVSSAGLEVDKAKIDVISKLPPPTNIKSIRSFLGHAGFYRRFIKDFSKIARPLTKLLEKDTPFEFDDECRRAFESLKEKLTCAPVIVSPNWNLSFELMCDASDFAIGAVLGQKDGKTFHPIYFASKTLNSAQQKYTVTEKELMAVVFAFDKFRSYLILSKTIVHTRNHTVLVDIDHGGVCSSLSLPRTLKRLLSLSQEIVQLISLGLISNSLVISHNVRNKSILRVLRIIIVILPEHPSETMVFHNEDGNPARANIKQALGYLKMEMEMGNSNFDVLVGMDRLSKRKFVIVCHEKVVEIPLEGSRKLRVQGERTLGAAKALMNAKVDEPKVGDISVVRDFVDVFPEDLSGLPPQRQVEFRIDLVHGATSVAKSPYRLAPLEMQELSEKLRELQDKVLELLRKEKLYAKVTYLRFIANFSKIVKTLTSLTERNQKYEWGAEREEAI
ncbi:reverse transcriptase domain-containing protein [Tanacetum coccineum]|uniref:Reverse transcriptase domain-containing protein n=1 Tax=Tanacetum coccineum TaxID=301880 RepID=A0ABQ5I0V9_9ASTR